MDEMESKFYRGASHMKWGAHAALVDELHGYLRAAYTFDHPTHDAIWDSVHTFTVGERNDVNGPVAAHLLRVLKFGEVYEPAYIALVQALLHLRRAVQDHFRYMDDPTVTGVPRAELRASILSNFQALHGYLDPLRRARCTPTVDLG